MLKTVTDDRPAGRGAGVGTNDSLLGACQVVALNCGTCVLMRTSKPDVHSFLGSPSLQRVKAANPPA